MTREELLKVIQKAKEEKATSLSLYDKEITELPPEIGLLTNLTHLSLMDNQLTYLPPEIGRLTNLKWLNLIGNKLVNIPPEIGRLTNLTELYLENNQMKYLPPEIGQLTNLIELSLHRNKLTSLPPEIGQLTNLTELDLTCNGLKSLPPEIGQLTNLRELSLGDNQLTSLPPEIGQLTNLKELSLDDNQLTSLPMEFGRLYNLTSLNISENPFTIFPLEIMKLTNLTKLSIYSNRLTNLPPEICQLTNLISLAIGNDQLTSLPPEILQLTNLTYLWLGINQLTSLPPEIGKMTNLTKLYLVDSFLTSLPPEIGKLTNLTRLDLRFNSLKSLPPEIGKLTNLTVLFLDENHLTSLPREIGKLSNLNRLRVVSNPLEDPPLEIAKQGIPAIREYFRQKEEAGSETLYEAKLLIVGEGGAGKTTLVRKIHDSGCNTQAEPSTEGIDISRWEFPLENGKTFRVNVWDFGGQEIYHNTHQFFLTSRSLYALVADSRREATNFRYWLQTVNALSNGSPTVIVKNRTDGRRVDIAENSLKKDFKNLKSVHDVYLTYNDDTKLKPHEKEAENAKIRALVCDLQEQLKALPLVGTSLPKTWVKVRRWLDTSPDLYVTMEAYYDICIENGISKTEHMLQLLGYLHDLGVVLHFKDDPLLKQVLFLRPEWVTDAVYKVLDNNDVKERLGRFGKEDLENIWKDGAYSGQHENLVQLMKVFGLCYELPGSPDTWIAPQLLSKDRQKKYDPPSGDCMEMHYSYDFLPSGLVVKLIMALHTLLESQDHAWQYGALFQRNGARAEVLELTDQNKICVRVNGQLKRELLTVVTYELDRIHSTFPGLKMSKKIPCCCSQCKQSDNPHYFDEDNLKLGLSKGIQEIQCQKSFEQVSITYLLNEYLDKEQLEKLRQESKVVNVGPGGIYVEGNDNVVGNGNVVENVKVENRQEEGSGNAVVYGKRGTP